jgi:uncharacterized protein YjaZ
MRIKLDLSSFEQFWHIVGILEGSTNPSKDDWNKLFDTPGYKALIASEFNKDFFKQSFIAAFDPEKEETLEKLLEGKTSRYLKYYSQVRKDKKTYEKNVKLIEEKWKKIHESIYARASAFLPYGESEENPTVSILIFDTDARGYETIVIDAIFANRLEDFVSLAAHEVHHFYRNQMLEYDKEDIEEEDKDLIWVINQIHAEGIADHIDKGLFIYGGIETAFPKSYVKYFKESVKRAPEIIKEINTLIENFTNNKLPNKELGQEIKKIVPLAGHPLGYYMANIIIKNAHFDELIRTVGNPFKFYELYNEAAKLDREKLSLYSEISLSLIEELEKKYVKQINGV